MLLMHASRVVGLIAAMQHERHVDSSKKQRDRGAPDGNIQSRGEPMQSLKEFWASYKEASVKVWASVYAKNYHQPSRTR
jgi:hypothetical protein